MPLNHELRSRGVGASEVAAIVGLDKWRDAFSVYAAKVGLVKPAPSTEIQKRGKYFERGICEWYGDRTHQKTQWFDQTVQSSLHTWQLVTPDAFVLGEPGMGAIGGVDAKSVNFKNVDDWGESGTDIVPAHAALQCAWTCSTLDMPWWDLAALVGGMDELRIYRIHRDPAIEEILLTEVEAFWTKNVLARVPPPPGSSPATGEALKQMFPRNVENLRCATEADKPLIEALKAAVSSYGTAKAALITAKNQIKLAIGDADGILDGKDKLTWKLCKDTMGTNWEAIARLVCEDEQRLRELIAEHRIIAKHGSRRLTVPRSWGCEECEE